jgi:two-component system chemotaxis response regulator CheB
MQPIKVLIVDDSLLMRKLLSELLADIPDIEVVGTANDAHFARHEIKRLNPDVVTLDVEMPGMDGMTFLHKVMTLRPMPVIMLSTLTAKGAEITLRAMELGAVDCICKPESIHTDEARERLKLELAGKIRIAARVNVAQRGNQPEEITPLQIKHINGAMLVALGSSTGGVEALRDIFKALPANSPPVVMTQHMPEAFIPSLAARLNTLSRMEVCVAKDGEMLRQGHAYLAPGNCHLKVAKKGHAFCAKLEDGPAISGHRPSVDALFSSIAECAGSNAVGVILTGMGKDGAAGLLKMREKGAYTIGQSESSCVVYGMPKAAASIGAVTTVLPLQGIAAQVLQHCTLPEGLRHAT